MARPARRERVGILVECGPDGLEIHLCRRICELLRIHHGATIREEIVPMVNKSRLIEECATAVGNLLAGGTDRVIILWDEEPAWPDQHQELCWHRDKEHILQSMRGAGLDLRRIHLVCIEHAFECWLLFDDRLLSRVLSRAGHSVRARPPRNPHRQRNVKGIMIKLFRRHGHRYVDVQWARRLAENLEDLSRLRKCSTFRRFAERVIDTTL
jgi:hypothetical protein